MLPTFSVENHLKDLKVPNLETTIEKYLLSVRAGSYYNYFYSLVQILFV